MEKRRRKLTAQIYEEFQIALHITSRWFKKHNKGTFLFDFTTSPPFVQPSL